MHDCSAEQPIPASEKFWPSGLLRRSFDVMLQPGTGGGAVRWAAQRRAAPGDGHRAGQQPCRLPHHRGAHTFEVDLALLTFTSVMLCTGLDRPATPPNTSPLRCDFTGLHVSRLGNGVSFRNVHMSVHDGRMWLYSAMSPLLAASVTSLLHLCDTALAHRSSEPAALSRPCCHTGMRHVHVLCPDFPHVLHRALLVRRTGHPRASTRSSRL